MEEGQEETSREAVWDNTGRQLRYKKKGNPENGMKLIGITDNGRKQTGQLATSKRHPVCEV